MRNRPILVPVLLLAFAGSGLQGYPQAKKTASSMPHIDVQDYKIEASLIPDAHEVKVASTIVFKPAQSTDFVIFQLSENLSVQKVLNSQGVELEFGQDEIGPGYLTVRFSKPLVASSNVTIRIECQGGFDRDRYSRMYTRDVHTSGWMELT